MNRYSQSNNFEKRENKSILPSEMEYSEFRVPDRDHRVGIGESGNVEGRMFTHVGYDNSIRRGEPDDYSKREDYRSSYMGSREVRDVREGRELRHGDRELRGGNRGKLKHNTSAKITHLNCY